MEFTRLATEPVPVWLAAIDAEKHRCSPPLTGRDLCKSFEMLKGYIAFRGVSLDRLPTILRTGVDVEPTSAPIFVSDFTKAWEYGGLPKAVMAFDGRQLKYTYREVVLADTPADEITQIMIDYPTRIESRTGERLWLTRFPETDTRATSSYEREYARWIPGDPFDSLRAVFVFIPQGVAELEAASAVNGTVET